MAVAFAELAAAGDTSNATTYSTASITPTAGSLLLVWVLVSDADDPGTINISTTLTGVTWVEQFNVPWNSTGTPLCRLKLWIGTGASGSGTITFSGMPDACQGAVWAVVEAIGYDTASPIVQVATHTDDVDQLTETCTFAAYASAANAVICAFGKLGVPVLTSEGGWTALTEASFATPDRRLRVQYQTAATDTTSNMTWITTVNASASGGVEIRAAVASTAVLIAADPFSAGE